MKMQSYSKILFLIFLFWGNTYALFAQLYYCDILYPDNHEEIRGKIFHCYSDRIDIDETTLDDFLVSRGDSSYDVDIPIPEVQISWEGNEELFFDWEDVPEAMKYWVRYINLGTGADSALWRHRSDYSHIVSDNKPYLFLFSTIVWNGSQAQKSADYIIIDEKPIVRDSLKFFCEECSSMEKTLPRNGVVQVSDDEALAPLSAVVIYPNPTTGESYLSYTLSATREVSVLLVDVLGKTRRELMAPVRQLPGLYNFPLLLDDFPVGLYQCLLKTEDGLERLPVLKID